MFPKCGIPPPAVWPMPRTPYGLPHPTPVAGINQLPLLPGILVALAFLMAIGSAWWREGRWWSSGRPEELPVLLRRLLGGLSR